MKFFESRVALVTKRDEKVSVIFYEYFLNTPEFNDIT